MNQERRLFLENLIKTKNLLANKQGQIFVGEFEKKQKLSQKGYLTVGFYKTTKTNWTFFSHQIVACLFHGFPATPDLVINHKNGVKTDNRPENLEWVTVAQNNQHAYDRGLRVPAYTFLMRRIPRIKEPKGERLIETLVIATFNNYRESPAQSAKAIGMCPQKFRRAIRRAKKLKLLY